MSDRELLEMAAKAAGLVGFVGEDFQGMYFCVPANPEIPRSEPAIYQWLKDDGDALRLAVKLHMDINFLWNGCDDQYDTVRVYTHGAKCDAEEGIGFYLESGQSDEGAATRRAIVRAAANRGKAMP